MPTQSERQTTANVSGEWAAHALNSKRSVYGNYRSCDPSGSSPQPVQSDQVNRSPASTSQDLSLQVGIDLAVARAFLHQWLSKAYEDPTLEGWVWLCSPHTQENLRSAWAAVKGDPEVLPGSAFSADAFDSFHLAYLSVFGHAARGSCPLNEIEYGDLKADPLFQPHRLADLAGFYRAFGLEVSSDAGERHDHICLELEFFSVLAAKEAYALEHQLDPDELGLCRSAQKTFLREHLGRWTPGFTRRLAASTSDPALDALARFTRAFIQGECSRFGVTSGGEELLLRPVDEAADRMCDSCGISNLPPGAVTAT